MDSGAASYERYLSGDDSGLAEIIREHKDGLMLYINSFTKDIHIAEELVEDVFFKLAVKKPKFSKKSSFKTWLYTVGRNLAIDHIRKSSKFSHSPIEEYENSLHEEETIEKAYLLEERKIALHRALKIIKAEYAQALHLVYFEGFSNEQAAKIMKKNRRQTENLLYRAKQALKEALKKEGFTYEEL